MSINVFLFYDSCFVNSMSIYKRKMAITSVKATVIATLPRRFSVQFDFILFTIDGFTFTPLFAQVVWYQRHGAVLQIQGGTVSHRHDHINH